MGVFLEILLISKRARDGKVNEKRLSIQSLKSSVEGCDMVLKTRLISGYCIKNADTDEILVQKGKI